MAEQYLAVNIKFEPALGSTPEKLDPKGQGQQLIGVTKRSDGVLEFVFNPFNLEADPVSGEAINAKWLLMQNPGLVKQIRENGLPDKIQITIDPDDNDQEIAARVLMAATQMACVLVAIEAGHRVGNILGTPEGIAGLMAWLRGREAA